ncbi:hypothetical protein [Allocoleopsis sp.]|uniref:hypothetical protein n=1 Tax=Allocoleopsis sp. TaxID=3088169 RepID=UPI002FD6BC73
MLVRINGDHRLFTIKYQIGETVTLTTFFPTYLPNGGAIFENYVVHVSQIMAHSFAPEELTADFNFQVGARVRYIGDAIAIQNSLQGRHLTIHSIGLKDIACIRDDETHLRFFRPSTLELIEEETLEAL